MAVTDTIICLGKITYEAVTREKASGFVEQLRAGRPLVASSPVCKSIKVYGVAHCGALGANNVGGMPVMLPSLVTVPPFSSICSQLFIFFLAYMLFL